MHPITNCGQKLIKMHKSQIGFWKSGFGQWDTGKRHLFEGDLRLVAVSDNIERQNSNPGWSLEQPLVVNQILELANWGLWYHSKGIKIKRGITLAEGEVLGDCSSLTMDSRFLWENRTKASFNLEHETSSWHSGEEELLEIKPFREVFSVLIW